MITLQAITWNQQDGKYKWIVNNDPGLFIRLQLPPRQTTQNHRADLGLQYGA